MNAGRMRHWIEIQAKTVTRDSGGGVTEVWATIPDGARWAEVRPIGSNERFDAQQLQEMVTHKISTRWLSGVSVGHQVLYDSRSFDVQSVINWGERSIELSMMCVERKAV